MANSEFNPNNGTIYLNELNPIVFLHELTHSFHYFVDGLKTPVCFSNFKFESAKENKALMASLLHSINQSRVAKLKTWLTRLTTTKDVFFDDGYVEYSVLNSIAGIIDSVYDGESYTDGIKVTGYKGIKCSFKVEKGPGHSTKYFNKNNYQFAEFIADYQAVKLVSPNSKYFCLLKSVLGAEFVSKVEYYLQCINSQIKVNNENLDDIISRNLEEFKRMS